MGADIKIAGCSNAVIKNFHARSAARRIIEQLDRTATSLPPLAMSVALAAVEVCPKVTEPPIAPLTVPALLVIVALPALEELPKLVAPPTTPLIVPPLFVKMALPAFEVSVN